MDKVFFGIILCFCCIAVWAQKIVCESGGNKKITQVIPKKSVKENQSPISGVFSLATNYVFRGISYTFNLPAIQGGYTYTLQSTGIYGNIWMSSVNFLDQVDKRATVEIDAIIGITNSIGKHFNYNLNLDRYNYPRTNSGYNEANLLLNLYFITAQLSYAPNVYNYGKGGIYYNLGFKFDLPYRIFYISNLSMSGGYGHYSLPRSKGLRSYNDYNLQFNKTFGPYLFALFFTDTNHRSIDLKQNKSFHAVGILTYNF